MPARTGKQFLQGLRGARAVWVDGERVADVTEHPKLTGAAHALAGVYDLQHEKTDIGLVPSTVTFSLDAGSMMMGTPAPSMTTRSS